MLSDDEPLLVSGRVNRPFRRYAGWGLVASGFIVCTVLVSVLGPTWNWGIRDSAVLILVVVIPALVLIFVGILVACIPAKSSEATTHFALTRRALWKREPSGPWEPIVSLADIRYVLAGTEDIRLSGYTNAGATMRVVDDQHRSYSVGPVDNPERWVQLIDSLCAEQGVTIESYVQPWVAKYNPPTAQDSSTRAGEVTDQARPAGVVDSEQQGSGAVHH